jgi:leucyl aminopeptidase
MIKAASRAPYTIIFGSANKDDAVIVPIFDRGSPEKTFSNFGAKNYPNPNIFSAKRGQTLVMPKVKGRHQILLGMGEINTLTKTGCEEIGAALHKTLAAQGFKSASLIVPHFGESPLTSETISAHIASGILLKAYSFTKYKSSDKPSEPVTLYCLPVQPEKAAEEFAALEAVSKGVYLARDLGNEPPNVAYPESIAGHVDRVFANSNVNVHIFETQKLRALHAGGILAVGQGSRKPPRMVVMEYDGTGGKSKRPDLALVGKGVTFDTGGISIKSAGGMEDMKYDMSGAADVVGTMLALSQRNARTHVIGVIGLAENMPDGNAYRPGDVVHLMSGKSVEIVNTDAEGRLVLSDCLTYVEKTYKPKAIIDLATLTGACIAALGHTMAAVITRDETLERKIVGAGRAVNELCWPMPLHDDFTRAVRASKIADIKNQAAGPGTSTAGAFLEQAILNKTPWAHLDIAGMAWNAPGKLSPDDGTASGFGVRLLNRLIADHFERKDAITAPHAKPAGPARKPQ